jgi:hypothetical protein
MNILRIFNDYEALKKRLVFVTGAPRSGTSMLAKVVDAHPHIAVLMENIFGNRRRHCLRANFWQSVEKLRKEVAKTYAKLGEPIVGNKVCTPDVWSADDIHKFCKLFRDFKIIFVVRDPVHVALSRFKREDYPTEFNNNARKNMLLDFRTQFLTYSSSWRQSIETFWKLRDAYADKTCIVYYENFCNNFEKHTKYLSDFLRVQFSEDMLNWCRLPHYNAHGHLQKDLKYPDAPVRCANADLEEKELPTELKEALSSIEWLRMLWAKREL